MDRPCKRNNLFVTELDGQCLIYDPDNNQSHCLSPAALQVWQLCDGQHATPAIIDLLQGEYGQALGIAAEDAPEIVYQALLQFTAQDLLLPITSVRPPPANPRKRLFAGALIASLFIPARSAHASGDACIELNQWVCIETPTCAWVGICVTHLD